MADTFRNFDLNTAEAFDDNDKRLVLEYIGAIWNSHKGRSDGCEIFEQFVRNELADFVHERHAKLSRALRLLVSNTVLVLILQVFAFCLFRVS